MIKGTRIYQRSDIRSLMSLADHIEVVENAFGDYAEGNILQPDLLHVETEHFRAIERHDDLPAGANHLRHQHARTGSSQVVVVRFEHTPEMP